MERLESPTLSYTYSFDEVSIYPGEVTINPKLTDTSIELAGQKLKFPILAASMDAIVDSDFAVKFSRLGGLAVLNLEGIQTRYENPKEVFDEIYNCPEEKSTSLLQAIYRQPVKDNLIAQRIQEIKAKGGVSAVSATPALAKKFGFLSKEAGADIFVIQSTVTTARHISSSPTGLQLDDFVKEMEIPIIVGNTVSYKASLELAESGVLAILCGVGPGAACTSREVLGIGVPQITATLNCTAARDMHFSKTGKYVPVITDGGFSNSGDICKALAAGADAVMIGSLFAGCKEAPGSGYHWGMATGNSNLPRGTRIKSNLRTDLNTLMFGPTSRADGKENLVGALKIAMGICGAKNITEFQKSELVHAPSIKTEGKFYQFSKNQD